MTIDSDATNGCGGFGSGLCSDYNGWVDEYGVGCDWYEDNEDPGCPNDGPFFPNEDGITANNACCYCSGGNVECITCYNTTDDECTNDAEWTAIVDNDTISCDWFERNDIPGCSNTYFQFLTMDNVSDPRESCCYCSEYGCQDVYEWHDVRWSEDGYGYGLGCDWYEYYDEPGCPNYGDKWPDNDDITAREACCYVMDIILTLLLQHVMITMDGLVVMDMDVIIMSTMIIPVVHGLAIIPTRMASQATMHAVTATAGAP